MREVLTGWTTREVLTVFVPVSVLIGFIWLGAALSPTGINGYTYFQTVLWGAGFSVNGVILRVIYRRRGSQSPQPLNVVLRTVPGWVFCIFTAGHGVLLGALLAIPWQFDAGLMMLAGALLAAPMGVLLKRSVL